MWLGKLLVAAALCTVGLVGSAVAKDAAKGVAHAVAA